MFFKLYLNRCILSTTQQYLGSRFYVPFVIILHSLTDKVKSRQISNILTPGFLLKCKTDSILSRTNQNGSKKKDKNIELELLACINKHSSKQCSSKSAGL